MAGGVNRRPAWLIGALIGAVLGGLVTVGVLLPARLGHWFAREPDPQTIVASSLRAVQRQQRMTVFAARFTAVVTSEQSRLAGILAAKKTLNVPGTVRYVVDWSRIAASDVVWTAASHTLSVRVPAPVIEGPEIDLPALREYKDGSVLMALTRSETTLDTANRAHVATAFRQEAASPLLLAMAREATAKAVERTFLLPLAAAGVEAKVVVTVG